MFCKHALFISASIVFAPSLLGCIFVNGNGPDDTTGGDTTEQDIAAYEAKQAQLEQHRQVFRKNAMEPAGVGTRLFWLEFPGFDPSLHSFDTKTNVSTDYGFSIGTGDQYNYRASDQIVVTAEAAGDKVVYHAFRLDKPEEQIDELSLPTPGNGVRWWAYAPDQGDVYYVTTIDSTALWKWTPGAGQPVELMTLEDTGAQIGEFWDFGVDGNTMIFIEGGRIWSLDIAAKKSKWLGNETESTSAFWENDGVLFSTAKGPFFYSYQSQSLSDISAAIASSGYQLSDTFKSSHLYYQDLARHQSKVGYIGSSGVFTYDLGTKTVKPILLNARDNSITYRYPVLLSDGTLFVKGLESTSGATGADGPLFRVDGAL